MKTCTRFHFEDLERDDTIFLSNEWGNEPQYPEGVTVTVARAHRTSNFGPMVIGTDGESYYLDDFDIVKYVHSV